MLNTLLAAIIQTEFMPHGFCINWSPALLTTYLIGDGLIFIAYLSISILLVYLINRRTDLSWKSIVSLFAAFILACGTTHLLGIFIIWTPVYWLDAVMKALTALISIATAIYLYLRIPVLLRIPSAEQLLQLNRQLSNEIEQRQAVELQLKHSEQRWKFALESGGDGVWDWDLQTGHVYMSPRCVEILGSNQFDMDSYLQDWNNIIHPDDRCRLLVDLQAHLSGQSERFSNEHRVALGDEQWRWIQTHGLVVSRDEQGKALRMIGTHTDISERNRLQWLQIAKIIESSPEAVLLVAENGSIQLANAIAAKIFAYSQADMIGLNVDDLVPAHHSAQHAEYRRTFILKNQARPMGASRSLSAVRADGSEFPVEISLTPVSIDNQMSVIASILDVTERRRLEHEMELMAMIYQAIGEAVIVADADNTIVAINDSFTELTGYSALEAIGQKTTLLRSGKHGPDFYQAMWHALNKTGHWQGEIWNRRKNGEIYHEWLVINTIFGKQGEVQRRVAMFSEITERKQVEQTIWRQANFDPLTNLANRRMFHERLGQEIKKCNRDRRSLAVMLLDLDHFKEVNDTLGHAMGDLLLREAAARLQHCVRDADTVARLGGDEFTIILTDLEANGPVDRVADAILHQLSDPFSLNGELAYISVSMGITFYPDDAKDAEQLVKNADQAMYYAKQHGRNCYSYFTFEMELSAQNRLRLSNDLRQAMANQEFLVYYQPIVNLADHSIHKAEALVRWQHPQRGLVSPAEFIPLAEETGLILDIGDWVFKTAAAQAVQWRKSYRDDFKISVNKSPVQINRKRVDGRNWASYLVDAGMPCDCIIIEITEGLLLEAGGTVSQLLYAYRDAGMQVALDDFGTGYSSLSYLKKFDIDYLKIDQSFTRNLTENSSDLALCQAIIVMAHKLGLKVIAEGIETEQQLVLLKDAGCDFGQGFYFAEPMSAEAFEDLLV